MLRHSVFAVLVLVAISATADAGAPPVYQLTNPLGLDFPHELIAIPAREVPNLPSGDLSVQDRDVIRPVQRETTPAGERLWFIATLKGGKDAEKVKSPSFIAQKTASPLTLSRDTPSKSLIVSNGIYDIRLDDLGTPALNAADPKTAIRPPITGIRLAGGKDFFGRFTAASNAEGNPIPSTTIEQGPVFIRVRQHYLFGPADPTRGNDHRHHYTVTLTFTVNDPWINIAEDYDLPHNAGNPKDLYTYDFGKDPAFVPDTVCFTPWFDYIRFGGNTEMKYTLLLPREKQPADKPFVALQPKWTQNPGSGQDFFITRGGPTPGAKAMLPPEFTGKFAEYDPDAPAVGIVAAFPAQWVDPYNQIPQANVADGKTASITFPFTRGARAYALCVGPRSLFDNTGKLDSLVRRRSDWTLQKQLAYELEWKRDPAKAGPHILIAREQLDRLRADFKAGKDTPEMAIVKEFAARRASLKGNDRVLLDLITGEKVNPSGPPDPSPWLITRYQNDFLNPTTATRSLAPRFAVADLTADGIPIGGPAQAALGYIFSDLDQWPGYLNGWSPGNPNFHTDKYMVAVYAAAAMLDHPDARKWLDGGKKLFDEDTAKVFLPPDGVGYECPGYSGYSANLQLEVARIFANTGYANPVAENPMWKQTATWHRHLITPFDTRIGLRHEAPIGDTHRWTSGFNAGFAKVAKAIKQSDPATASELMATYRLLEDQGGLKAEGLIDQLVAIDRSIPPADLAKMDWGSHAFYGFGSVMRTRFGQPDETFVSFKAGPNHGHYHNDELSYHFYGAGTPLSLDYNCSYHPRRDLAALHNSMTFGYAKPFTHAGDTASVPAQEQLFSVARVGAFNSTPAADIIVAERSGDELVLSPIYPDQARFGYAYPARKVDPIIHRRTLVLVKHPAGSKLADYLVVRDETQCKDPQQINIHLLARDVQQDPKDKSLFRAPGQWDTDALVFLAQADLKSHSVGRWYYFDENMSGPDKRPRDTGRGIDPADKAEQEAWHKRIADTDGQALIPPTAYKGKWLAGEYQKWLRLETAPGSTTTWVLYPQKHGSDAPTFTSLGTGVEVKLGPDSDLVLFANDKGPAGSRPPDGAAWIRQNNNRTILLPLNSLPKLGDIKQEPLTK